MIDLVTSFRPYVDEQFKAESKKSLVTNSDFDWTGAHTIKVYKVSTSKMNDYQRTGKADGSRYGEIDNLDAVTEEMTLKKDRSFTFTIDKLDEDETGRALQAASALARQVREVVIPEVDSYVYMVMAENAGVKPEPVQLTVNNIYDEITNATESMDDNEVLEDGRQLIVTPRTYRLMKKSPDIVLNTDMGEDLRIRGVVANLDGMNVVKVPSKRLPQNFGFMVCHPVATVAPTKLEDYKVHKDPPGISGSLVEGRVCYDAFVLDNKVNAIYYQAETEIAAEGK
ncbi:MAG: hypothetical protein HFG35_12450 [Eubacterium sp.]|jgi:hypothetical protein|uniref:phage major capsid protein n=1 Tax=Parablautia intestinalis TaxID=2320100 RepID=UPI002171AA8A|nr:hypothetical protein [Parablautia intestinalis]MCI9539051.1 hypothetical protein [Eubacterium sp.]